MEVLLAVLVVAFGLEELFVVFGTGGAHPERDGALVDGLVGRSDIAQVFAFSGKGLK